MHNLFLSMASCLLFMVGLTSSNLLENDVCAEDQLFSELTTKNEDAEIQPIVYLLNEKPFNGTAVKHLEGNESCLLYSIKNGIIIKKWGFFSSGELSREEYFKEGLPHGLSIQYYENGRKASEINYKSGILHGSSCNWDETGSITRNAKYNMGTLISEKF